MLNLLEQKKINRFKNSEGLTDEEVDEVLYTLRDREKYLEEPVGIREFIESEFYLDSKDIVYPIVLNHIEELNSGDYTEAVLTGGIGTAKTTIALYSNAYQLYLLSCLANPHAVFNLDPSSEIVFIFQNINAKKAKEVDYERFRAMVDKSPYFKNYFNYDKDTKSQMQFPNRIYVKPVSGDATGTIGENVIGGLIDEVNFMDIISDSKRSADSGTYDQAQTLYNSLARRRESRFMMEGELPGILCLVSSKRYPGEFTDRKIEEAKTDPSIYVYDKRIWEIKPEGTFSKETFTMYIGSETREPYIVTPEAPYSGPKERLLNIPVDFLKQFQLDPLDALREIGGISLRSVHPFIMNVEAVAKCFRGKSCLNLPTIDFATQKLLISPNNIRMKGLPRFIHIDLGLTSDHAGLAMGYCPGFAQVDRGEGMIESLPRINIDFALDIMPPVGGEIDYARIRTLIYKLWELGVNVKWITMDQFNSADMLQRFKQKGFSVGRQSVDAKADPYLQVKSAIYDNRLQMPVHPKLRKELINLEMDVAKEKIDHPANGSKDVADGLAGVVYGLCMNRDTWLRYEQSPSNMNSYVKKYVSRKDAIRQKEGVEF